MKDTFDIFKTSKAPDANKRNTTNNSNLNNHQYQLPTNNNNNTTYIQKRNTTKSILQYFPSITVAYLFYFHSFCDSFLTGEITKTEQ